MRLLPVLTHAMWIQLVIVQSWCICKHLSFLYKYKLKSFVFLLT